MITLQEAKPGSSYRVEGLTLPIDLERRLEALGLIEGSEFLFCERSGKGAMIVKVRGTRFAVGYGISSHISVEKGGTGHGA